MILRYNIFTIIWCFIIILLTLFPGGEMPDISIWDFFSFDKFAHIFVFAVLVLLMIVGFTKQYTYQFLRVHAVRYSIIFSASLGLAIEFFQSLVPGRGFEYMDLIADIVGCFAGWLAFYFIYKFELN